MAEERFDGLFLNVTQQSQGIEPLLDNLFSFLRRKTDFFVGASEEVIESTVLSVIRKHAAISAKAEKEKKAAREKEERLKEKKKLEKEKKLKEEKEKAAAASSASKPAEEDDVIEMSEDGTFDADTVPTGPAKTASTNSVNPPAAPTAAEIAKKAADYDVAFPKPTTTNGGEADADSEAAQKAKEDEEDNTPPPVGNGGSTDKYVWTQQLADLTINVPVPEGTRSKFLDVQITNTKLKVGVKGQPYIIDGEFYNRVIVDDSFWTLEDGEVVLSLQKDNRMEWWKSAIKGDAEINTQKVQPENSKLGDLDGETRQTVEKMMFDQRQKAMGKPTSDEMNKQAMLEKFMAAHPEMDFSNTKFT